MDAESFSITTGDVKSIDACFIIERTAGTPQSAHEVCRVFHMQSMQILVVGDDGSPLLVPPTEQLGASDAATIQISDLGVHPLGGRVVTLANALSGAAMCVDGDYVFRLVDEAAIPVTQQQAQAAKTADTQPAASAPENDETADFVAVEEDTATVAEAERVAVPEERAFAEEKCALRCPHGHELTKTTEPKTKGGSRVYTFYSCDGCHRGMPVRKDAPHHCGECEYDLCGECAAAAVQAGGALPVRRPRLAPDARFRRGPMMPRPFGWRCMRDLAEVAAGAAAVAVTEAVSGAESKSDDVAAVLAVAAAEAADRHDEAIGAAVAHAAAAEADIEAALAERNVALAQASAAAAERDEITAMMISAAEEAVLANAPPESTGAASAVSVPEMTTRAAHAASVATITLRGGVVVTVPAGRSVTVSDGADGTTHLTMRAL